MLVRQRPERRWIVPPCLATAEQLRVRWRRSILLLMPSAETPTQLHKKIMRRMVLNASCVIDGAWLRVPRANQVCIWDRRRFSMSASVRTMFGRACAVAILEMSWIFGRRHILLEMKGISGRGCGCLLCRTRVMLRLVVANRLLARLRMQFR